MGRRTGRITEVGECFQLDAFDDHSPCRAIYLVSTYFYLIKLTVWRPYQKPSPMVTLSPIFLRKDNFKLKRTKLGNTAR